MPTSPTPTPAANPYAPKVVEPTVPISTGSAAMPAVVSGRTGADIIAETQAQRSMQNEIVLQQSGRNVSGGSKRKHKRSSGHKRRSSNKRSKRKQSNKRKRCKRGGQPSPSPSPSPNVIPVPQFAGSHNAGANANSAASNTVLVNAAEQATYDNPNGKPTFTKVI